MYTHVGLKAFMKEMSCMNVPDFINLLHSMLLAVAAVYVNDPNALWVTLKRSILSADTEDLIQVHLYCTYWNRFCFILWFFDLGSLFWIFSVVLHCSASRWRSVESMILSETRIHLKKKKHLHERVFELCTQPIIKKQGTENRLHLYEH